MPLFPGPTTFPGPEAFTGASAEDVTTPTPDPDPQPEPQGLLALFDADAVRAELDGRSPRLLKVENATKLEHIARGVAAEVTQLVERVPPEGWVRDLAVACMHLGVASRVESSAFPEQQGQGDQGRAQLLQARYLGARAQLLQAATDGGADGVVTAGPGGGGFGSPGGWVDGAQRTGFGPPAVLVGQSYPSSPYSAGYY